MKRLILLRHAKSEWSEEDLDDHARPLNERGRAAATRMGAYMREQGITPDVVVCSTAARTCETLDLLLEAHGCSPKVVHDRGIYLAMPEQMLETTIAHLAKLKSPADCVMIVGHNPGTHGLAAGLSRGGDPERRKILRDRYPTAAMTVIDCDIDDWKQVYDGGELKAFVMPRELANG